MNTLNLLHKLPKSFQATAERFFEEKSFEGPRNDLTRKESDSVLLTTESGLNTIRRKDNTEKDRNPKKGEVEAGNVKATFVETGDELEVYSEVKVAGPFTIVSLARQNPGGLDKALVVFDENDKVFDTGVVHLNREDGSKSFAASGPEGL